MSIDRYLARESESLEAALGLKANHGGLTWWRREAIHERDLALCHLATAHFSDLPPTQQARAIAVAARRYGACGWRSDQRLTTLPSQEIATVRGHLFRAFKSGAPLPLCERQVRNILRQKKFTVTQQGHSSPKPGEIAVTLA